jgi:hypothetical protein
VKSALFLWIFLVISFCGISKPIDSLIVEYGGGMSGQVTEHKIIQNTIYKSSYRILKAGQPQVAITSSKRLKGIYKTSKKLLAEKEGFDRPGNMYKSITIYLNGKKVQYKWGDASFEVPAEVKDLYDQLLTLIKELKFQ